MPRCVGFAFTEIMAITEAYKLRSNFSWLNMYAEMSLLCCKSIQEKSVGRKGRNTNGNTQLGFPSAFEKRRNCRGKEYIFSITSLQVNLSMNTRVSH